MTWYPMPAWARALISLSGSFWLSCLFFVHVRTWALGQEWAAPLAIASPVLTVLFIEGFGRWERAKLISKVSKEIATDDR